MPSVDLTSYYQPTGSTSDGTKFDNALAAIQSALNSLDNTNFVLGTPLAVSKLAPGSNGQVLTTSGGVPTWAASAASTTGTELDYVQITADSASISATTEGGASTIITGTSQAYDATKKNIEVYWPRMTAVAPLLFTFVVLRGATVVGQHNVKGYSDTADLSGGCFTVQDTPSAATFSYVVKAFVSTSSAVVKAGAGGAGTLLPAHLRVTKA